MAQAIFVDVGTCRDALRNEYLDQPSLRLTLPEAQRLWGIGRPTCERALYELLCEGFLVRTVDGQYCRPHYTTPDD